MKPLIPSTTIRPPVRLRPVVRAIGLALLATPAVVAAQTTTAPTQTLPPVQVTGDLVSPPLTQVTEDIAASPANVTVLGRKQLDQKTITTYGDIFRGVPGVFVNEFGQGLIAYEIKFRGFAGDHARDIGFYLDGVPLNVTGSQHTNGYADLAQIIPELLDRVELVRGPFSVYAGNHAVAGSVQLYTDRYVPSSIKTTVDSFGRVRILPIYSTAAGPGTLLLAVDATKGSAYTKQSDIERLNIFARYAFPIANGTAALRLQSYNAIAEAPDYLSLARIRSGDIDKRDARVEGAGDAKHQQNIVLNYRSDDADGRSGLGSGWISSLYFVRDRRERYRNSDLSLPSGSSVPLRSERDRLHQAGLDIRKITSFSIGTMPSQLATGVQYNRESIDALNFVSDSDRHQLAPSAAMPDVVGIDRKVITTTRSAYTQLQVQPVPELKLTAGLRYDHLDFDVRLNPQDDTIAPAIASGLGTKIDASAARFSPKLGAGLQVFDSSTSTIDLYANYAQGLKSPYAFSDFFSNVASSAGVPDLGLSSLRSFEGGAQGRAKTGTFHWRVGYWDTRQQNEGQRNDAGFFQSFGTTTRRGFDVEGSLAVNRAARVYASYSGVRARSVTAPSGEDRIPNVPEWIGTIGVQSAVAAGPHRFDLSLEDSIVGPQPVTADNTVRGGHYNRVTARAAYSNPAFKGATTSLTLIAYDRQLEETQFDFGGGAVGVSPRPTVKAIFSVQFPLNF